MLLKCAIRYVVIGAFVIYGTVTINMLSWISDAHLPMRAVTNVQGQNKWFWYDNTTDESSEMDDSVDVDDEEKLLNNPFVNQGLYNQILYENNMKRKRKILAELIHEYHINKVNPTGQFQFRSIGDISLFSAFYDDRDNFDNDVPVVRIMGISLRDSTENLVCRYTNKGVDSWILASRYEMCDNHERKYGGYMYICNTPQTIDIIPKKVYLQSLSGLSADEPTMTGKSISLDVLPIWTRGAQKLLESTDITKELREKLHISRKTHIAPDDKITNDHIILEQADANEVITSEADDNNYLTGSLNENAQTISLGDIRSGINISDNLRKNLLDSLKNLSLDLTKKFKITSNKEIKHILNLQNQHSKIKSNKSVIAACIPPLHGKIKLSEFIQFIEMNMILGVEHFFIYTMSISNDIAHLLDYYGRKGILTRIQWSLPTPAINALWNNGQIVAVQDCLYRSMVKYDYVAFIDIDELIIPKLDLTWAQMIHRLNEVAPKNEGIKFAGFKFRSAYFSEKLPKDYETLSKPKQLSFLRALQRTKKISTLRTKMIVRPEYIVEMGIHHVSKPINITQVIKYQDVDWTTALLHHYRLCPVQADENMTCRESVEDQSITKYDSLLNRKYQIVVKNTIKHFKTL